MWKSSEQSNSRIRSRRNDAGREILCNNHALQGETKDQLVKKGKVLWIENMMPDQDTNVLK